MAKARAKYKAKNIHGFKIIRECSHPHCDEYGIVTYWDDPDAEHRKVEHRCIEHVHWIKEPTEPTEPKAKNTYRTMTDFRRFLYTPAQRMILER